MKILQTRDFADENLFNGLRVKIEPCVTVSIKPVEEMIQFYSKGLQIKTDVVEHVYMYNLLFDTCIVIKCLFLQTCNY